MTKASPRADGIEVVLAHASEIAYSVWAQAGRDAIVVGCAAMHEQRPDAAEALAIVAQLLCGEREVPGYDGSVLRPDFGARPPGWAGHGGAAASSPSPGLSPRIGSQ